MSATLGTLSPDAKILVVGVPLADEVKELFANRVVFVEPDDIRNRDSFPPGIETLICGRVGKHRGRIVDCAHSKRIWVFGHDKSPDETFAALDLLTKGLDLTIDPFPASALASTPDPPRPPQPSIEERVCELIRTMLALPVESCTAEAVRLLPTIQTQISPTMSHATLTRLISRVNNEPRESSPAPRVIHSPIPLPIAPHVTAPIRNPDPPAVTMHKPGQGELKAFVLQHRDPDGLNCTTEAERLLVEAGKRNIETTRNSIRQTLYALAKESVIDTSKAATDKTRANPPASAPGKPVRKARPEPESAKPEPSSLSILAQEAHELLERQDHERTTLAVRHTEENSALILRQLQEQRKLFFGDAK